jgi:hypothetical protein
VERQVQEEVVELKLEMVAHRIQVLYQETVEAG